MRTLMKILAGTAGLAAFAAAPAAAQYAPYGYSSPYGYSNPYGSQYGYGYNGYAMNTSAAQQQCTAAVQNRLYNRTSLGSILGSMIGLPTANNARIIGITSVTPHRGSVTVRGLASSGRYASNNYGPYGVGAYGALGYAYQPDLSFKCTVDYRGYVRDVDINRR